MAYKLTCDNKSCGSVVDSGPGQPALAAKQTLYCHDCGIVAAQVEATLQSEMIQLAHEGIERINTRRGELMAKMLPQTRGGSGEGYTDWPQIQGVA